MTYGVLPLPDIHTYPAWTSIAARWTVIGQHCAKMAAWTQAARGLASLGLKAQVQGADVMLMQARRMGGGGPIGIMHHSKGKPTPPELQGPDFITYAGLTISKPKVGFEHYWTKFMGGLFWFTMLYHFSLNWEEHWYGDIWVFEKDVQMNGWDDDHAHGHGHGHH